MSINEIIFNRNSPDSKSLENGPLLCQSGTSDVEISPQLFNNPGTPEVTNESSFTVCERNCVPEEVPAKIARMDLVNELTKVDDDDDVVRDKMPRMMELDEKSSYLNVLVDKEDAHAPENHSQEFDASKQEQEISNDMLLERQQDSNERATGGFSTHEGFGKEPENLAVEKMMEINHDNDARLITNNPELMEIGSEVSSSCSLFSQEMTNLSESNKGENCSITSWTVKCGLKVDGNVRVSGSNVSKETEKSSELKPEKSVQTIDDNSLDELFNEEGEFIFEETARDHGKETELPKGMILQFILIISMQDIHVKVPTQHVSNVWCPKVARLLTPTNSKER